MTRWRNWMRHPVVHFAAIGALVAVVDDYWRQEAAAPASVRAPVVVSAERVHQMRTDFAERWGFLPTPAQLRALVSQFVEEEILYREARLLALDFGDASVRRRLLEKARAVTRDPTRSADELVAEAYALGLDDDVVVERLLATKMRLLLQQENAAGAIAIEEIVEYRDRHRERFTQPRTVSFTHVFFSRAVRGTGAPEDARRALIRIAAAAAPPAQQLSDPFPLGQHLVAYTETQLAGRFGRAFADRVLALEPGGWAGPVESPYGAHLVRVEEHIPPRLAPLDTVRESIELALRKERAADNLAHGLARLRALYEVRIEGSEFAAEVHDEVPAS